MDISNAQLRQFLTTYFSSEEIDHLCFDYFPRVQAEFTAAMPRGDRIQLLLAHCRQHGERDRLIGALRQLRPRAFQQDFELAQPEPAPVSDPVAPTSRNPRQIFISHASEDAKLAHRLAADLQKNNWQVWLAPDSIQPSEKWVAAINRGLAESGIFLLLISQHAVQSRWVKSETDIAIQWEHERKMRFIPLQTSSRPVANIPALWQAYQFIPFAGRYQNGLAQLLAKLDERLYTPPPSKPPVWQKVGEWLKDVPKPVRLSLVVLVVLTIMITQIDWSFLSVAPDTTDPNALPTNANLHDTWTRQTDGMTMMFVPGGTFMMGSDPDDDSDAQSDEQPQHEVSLDAFWVDQHEVTNAQFAAFLNVEGNEEEGGVTWLEIDSSAVLIEEEGGVFQPKEGFGTHPVIEASWYGANAYCQWAGGKLPTEAQWEYVARGTDGRLYPWGNEAPNDTLLNYNNNVDQTTAVGSYSPQGDSWLGVQDIAGNVWEWTADWYGSYSNVSQNNPTGPADGIHKVLRGGSFIISSSDLRNAHRFFTTPIYQGFDVGFRCVAFPGS